MIRTDEDLDRLLRVADPLPIGDDDLSPAALALRDRIMVRRHHRSLSARLAKVGAGTAITVLLFGGGSLALAANGLGTPWGWVADNVFHVNDSGQRDCFNGIQVGSGGLGEDSQLRKDAIHILRNLDIASLDTSEMEAQIRESLQTAPPTDQHQNTFGDSDAGIRQRALWIVTSQAVWNGLKAKGYSDHEIGLIDLTGRSSCY